MSNPQTPQFFTLSAGQTLTITYSRAISVYSAGGVTNVTNSVSQTIALQSGLTLDLEADNGNTLTTTTIVAQGGATSYVTMIGGSGVVS